MAKKRNNNVVRRRARFDVDENANYIRSRTISGYDPSDDIANNETVMERTFEQKRSSKKRRKLTIFGIALILIGLILLLMSQFTVGVSSVQYEQPGVTAKRDNEYLSFTNQYLAEHPSERFLWLLNDSELLATAKEHYPEISQISIKNNIVGGGKVVVSLREPVAVWRSGNNRSYVDSSGAVFGENFFNEPNITITDQNNSGQIDGISSRMLEFIGKTISGIESRVVGKVKEVIIPVSAARYVEMKLVDREFYIKVQIDRDVDSQITDIENMVKFVDEKKINPSYIDVRVKNRGFWK